MLRNDRGLGKSATMPRITTHEHFCACLDAFLKQVAADTGMVQTKDQNMLQFVIGLGAGVGPTDHHSAPPIAMQFREHLQSPMKTIIHITHTPFTAMQALRIESYFNHKHGAKIAHVTHVPYLKGNHENIEILSGALVDELDLAIQYQEVFRASLMLGPRTFLSLPISEKAKAALQAKDAQVEFVPYPGDISRHKVEFRNISEEIQQEIMRAIDQKYGSGSVQHG